MPCATVLTGKGHSSSAAGNASNPCNNRRCVLNAPPEPSTAPLRNQRSSLNAGTSNNDQAKAAPASSPNSCAMLPSQSTTAQATTQRMASAAGA